MFWGSLNQCFPVFTLLPPLPYRRGEGGTNNQPPCREHPHLISPLLEASSPVLKKDCPAYMCTPAVLVCSDSPLNSETWEQAHEPICCGLSETGYWYQVEWVRPGVSVPPGCNPGLEEWTCLNWVPYLFGPHRLNSVFRWTTALQNSLEKGRALQRQPHTLFPASLPPQEQQLEEPMRTDAGRSHLSQAETNQWWAVSFCLYCGVQGHFCNLLPRETQEGPATWKQRCLIRVRGFIWVVDPYSAPPSTWSPWS